MLQCPVCSNGRYSKKHSLKDMVIYRCIKCGMMFQDPSQALVRSNRYAVDVFEKVSTYQEIQRLVSKSTIERIAAAVGRPMAGLKVLEIGSGVGSLACQLIEAGVDYTGIEPSQDLYCHLLKINPQLEGKVLNGVINDVQLSRKNYDLLVMVDTLEHISYPVDYLRSAKQYLIREGLIYIEVPNESWLYIKGVLRSWLNVYSGYLTHPGHVNLFQIKTIQDTLLAADYRDVKVGQFSVFSDYDRMKWALRGKWSLMCRMVCAILKYSKIDLLLQQGNLSACAKI